MDSWLLYTVAAVYPLALAWAMLSDLRRFEIPNAVPILLLAGYLVASLVHGTDALVILRQCGIGAVALTIGFGLFALKIVGGGDVKLVAAIVPWLAPAQIPSFLFWMALVGGLIALVIVALRRVPALSATSGSEWFRQLRDGGKIPYGLAIGCAGLITFANIPILAN